MTFQLPFGLLSVKFGQISHDMSVSRCQNTKYSIQYFSRTVILETLVSIIIFNTRFGHLVSFIVSYTEIVDSFLMMGRKIMASQEKCILQEGCVLHSK